MLFLVGHAELLGGGGGDAGQSSGARRLGEPSHVPLGGEADGHHVVLVDVVQRHVANLAAGHDHVRTSVTDGLKEFDKINLRNIYGTYNIFRIETFTDYIRMNC